MHAQPHPQDRDLLVITVDDGINDDVAESHVSELEAEIRTSNSRRLIVDCSRVNFLSSYGLSMLLRLRNTTDAIGGEVKLSGLSEVLREMLRHSKMESLFLQYPDVEQARHGFALTTASRNRR